MNNFLKTILLVVLPINIYAHSLLLNIVNNNNNTITVEGIFNTGESASGALIKLESIETKETLYKKRLPDISQLTINIPKEPYLVILDGGEGHQVSEQGVPPKEGFLKENKDKKTELEKDKSRKKNIQLSSSNAVIVSIVLAFVLLFATILINIRNTNRLLKEMKKKK